MEEFEAVPPYRINGIGVADANGDCVIVCSVDGHCTRRYAESKVDSDPHFICGECGQLGQRMEEATPEICGLTPPAKGASK